MINKNLGYSIYLLIAIGVFFSGTFSEAIYDIQILYAGELKDFLLQAFEEDKYFTVAKKEEILLLCMVAFIGLLILYIFYSNNSKNSNHALYKLSYIVLYLNIISLFTLLITVLAMWFFLQFITSPIFSEHKLFQTIASDYVEYAINLSLIIIFGLLSWLYYTRRSNRILLYYIKKGKCFEEVQKANVVYLVSLIMLFASGLFFNELFILFGTAMKVKMGLVMVFLFTISVAKYLKLRKGKK